MITSPTTVTDQAMEQRLRDSMIAPSASVADALAQLDRAGTGALMLCDGGDRLLGILTDGDVRRGILRGKALTDPCASLASRCPVTAEAPVTPSQALQLFNERDINQLPVLSADGRIVQFLLRSDLRGDSESELPGRRVRQCSVSPSVSVGDAMAHLDRTGHGVLLLCDVDGRLAGVLTDGDIRRAILRGTQLSDACDAIASHRAVTVIGPLGSEAALRIMDEHDIHQLPVLDCEGRVQSLLLRRDLVVQSADADLSAVVMAGGYGMRLRPLTEALPKPMLPVGDRPLLELTIGQLRRAGIKDVSLTTHYLPEAISGHFGNGESFGVRLNYLHEEHPLGTAGGLRLLKNAEGTMLVINGDVLTGAPFPAMLAYHRQHRADLTVGVRKYEMQVPFGVVECDDVRVTQIREKPSLSFFINAGAYLLEPHTLDLIPEGRHFDMTDLIQKLVETGRIVVSYPIVEYWLDIGRQEDYQRAQDDVLNGRIS